MAPKVMFEMNLGRKLDFLSEKAIGIYKRVVQRFIGKKLFAQTIALKKIISHLKPSQVQDRQDKEMENIIRARLHEQILRENSSNS